MCESVRAARRGRRVSWCLLPDPSGSPDHCTAPALAAAPLPLPQPEPEPQPDPEPDPGPPQPPGAAAGSGAGSAPAAPPQPHGAAPLPALKASPTRPQRQPAEGRKVSGPGPVSGAGGHGGGSGAQSGGLEVPCHGRERGGWGGQELRRRRRRVQPPANNNEDKPGRPRSAAPGVTARARRVGSGRVGAAAAALPRSRGGDVGGAERGCPALPCSPGRAPAALRRCPGRALGRPGLAAPGAAPGRGRCAGPERGRGGGRGGGAGRGGRVGRGALCWLGPAGGRQPAGAAPSSPAGAGTGLPAPRDPGMWARGGHAAKVRRERRVGLAFPGGVALRPFAGREAALKR